jgi:hypothetical protein
MRRRRYEKRGSSTTLGMTAAQSESKGMSQRLPVFPMKSIGTQESAEGRRYKGRIGTERGLQVPRMPFVPQDEPALQGRIRGKIAARTPALREAKSAFGLTGKKGAQARVPVPPKGEERSFGYESAVPQERDEN